MRKFGSVPIKSYEITPEHVYNSRRQFLKLMGVVGAGAMLAAACGVPPKGTTAGVTSTLQASPTATDSNLEATTIPEPTVGPASGPTPGIQPTSTPNSEDEVLTTYDAVTNYTNYYEFTTDKGRVAKLAEGFVTSPWSVEVSGLVHNPRTFGVDDLLKMFDVEERVYRFRCVEAWSMVIPWLGFPLSRLLDQVEPMGNASYVRFETIYSPEQMPGQRQKSYPWPYQEGLRMDEAKHDLTILSTGLYGKDLLPQNGAPLRLVVPWKYGFKSIKSIVKIELTEKQPATLWSTIAPNEYGFYANVNPEVHHPRWSQATERRIGETGRIPTLMFNGYGEEVAGLYAGMDLTKDI